MGSSDTLDSRYSVDVIQVAGDREVLGIRFPKGWVERLERGKYLILPFEAGMISRKEEFEADWDRNLLSLLPSNEAPDFEEAWVAATEFAERVLIEEQR